MSSFDENALHDLLALERSYDDLPSGAEQRILTSVETAIGASGGGDGGDGGDGGPGEGGAPTTAATAASKFAPWLARAAYVAVGAVAGASGHALVVETRRPPPPPMATVLPTIDTVAAPASAPIPTLSIEALPSTSTTAVARAAASAGGVAGSRREDARIAEERADLDVARTALSRGHVEAARTALERHVRTYGEGHFAEEREALAIQALVAAGNGDDATARARGFRAKYPNSLFGPAVEQTLAGAKK